MQEQERDIMSVMIEVREEPLKAVEGVTMTPEQIEDQGDHAREAMVDVSAEARGTCIDERKRVGLKSGESKVDPRQSVPGGPNVYGLYIAEMIDYFGGAADDAKDRLRGVTKTLNAAKIPSGGHAGCAANAGVGAVLGLIGGDNREAGRLYAQEQLGDDFDPQAYDEATTNAARAAASGRYDDWTEDVLIEVLGDEADEAIEILVSEPHKGRTFIRSNVAGKTVDQTTLHNLTGGEDSFVNDEPYADRIENALLDGPNAEWKAKVARHAREALLAALYPALPNNELHQITLK